MAACRPGLPASLRARDFDHTVEAQTFLDFGINYARQVPFGGDGFREVLPLILGHLSVPEYQNPRI